MLETVRAGWKRGWSAIGTRGFAEEKEKRKQGGFAMKKETVKKYHMDFTKNYSASNGTRSNLAFNLLEVKVDKPLSLEFHPSIEQLIHFMPSNRQVRDKSFWVLLQRVQMIQYFLLMI